MNLLPRAFSLLGCWIAEVFPGRGVRSELLQGQGGDGAATEAGANTHGTAVGPWQEPGGIPEGPNTTRGDLSGTPHDQV